MSSLIKTKTIKNSLLGLLVVGLLWFLLVRPELARLSNTVGAKLNAEKIVAELENKKKFVAQAEAEYATIVQDLTKLDSAIPAESQAGVLVSQIEQLSKESGVAINSLSTEEKNKIAPKKSKNTTSDSKEADDNKAATSKTAATFADSLLTKYNALVVSVQVRAPYDNLRQFMSKLRALDRFIVISGLNSTVDQQDPNQLSSNIVIYAYWRAKPLWDSKKQLYH